VGERAAERPAAEGRDLGVAVEAAVVAIARDVGRAVFGVPVSAQAAGGRWRKAEVVLGELVRYATKECDIQLLADWIYVNEAIG
jgi:hypothetical protein